MLSWVWQPVGWSVIFEAIRQTVKGAGMLDYFDILASTLFIYVAIRWVHRARIVRVLQGIFVIGLLYLAARQTGLVLTTSVFRGLLTLIMISIVSLFQEDLRHLFERMTVYQTNPMTRHIFRSILRSLRHFARHHIGALIVLKGKDPLDRHVYGGQLLDGRISSPLLESLFDPHSAGHDGAAIVDGDTIARFGVHLPLSKNIDQDSGLGTRHAAALGLSEMTDAFCLVVSETRGTVMIAHGGRLLNMGSGRRLEARVSEFLRHHFQPEPGRRVGAGWLRDHVGTKFLSIVLGAALWLVFVKGIHPAEVTLAVPVRAGRIPEGYRVLSLVPAQAKVVLRGLDRDLRAVPATLAIDLNLPATPKGIQNVGITTSMLPVSPRLSAVNISPDIVTVSVEALPLAVRKSAAAVHRRIWFSLR